MSYLGDPRENIFNVESGLTWDFDNRIEERHKWNGFAADLCDMSPDEYGKTIFKIDGNVIAYVSGGTLDNNGIPIFDED